MDLTCYIVWALGIEVQEDPSFSEHVLLHAVFRVQLLLGLDIYSFFKVIDRTLSFNRNHTFEACETQSFYAPSVCFLFLLLIFFLNFEQLSIVSQCIKFYFAYIIPLKSNPKEDQTKTPSNTSQIVTKYRNVILGVHIHSAKQLITRVFHLLLFSNQIFYN